jgi:hypothetical protein
MQAPSPVIAAQLQCMRQQAREDSGRDIDFVRAWRPTGESERELYDWMFVAAQVLTVAELSWPPAGS